MVVYKWWCNVDCHLWTLCILLYCNADSWNMQKYFQYLDKEATAIGIANIDESAKLASRTRVKPLLAVQKERWNRCNSQHLTSFTCHRIAHQITTFTFLNVLIDSQSEVYKKSVATSVLAIKVPKPTVGWPCRWPSSPKSIPPNKRMHDWREVRIYLL